ncbi:hypothetical protein GTV32_22925 [Gordonia sp. SID5947]|uniref:hypothetical protein n=1 Tax=Gordonia sp. SID5947 TaxID=2690315 RepID=UPI00136D68AB|nr:hypothetical protein [Gordonia sp. SID5947]MYR08990.1 hypothetical protein [Gordonia sp. SID5947]
MLIGAAALLVIILLIFGVAAACGGSGDDESATDVTSSGIGSAHGPASIVAGIPAKYTHDKPGAATAAVNFAQSVDQARDGKVSGDKLKDIAVGPEPSEALTQVLAVASGRAEDRSVFNSAPAMVTVPNYTDDRATVAVWSVGASQAPVNDAGKVGVLTLWTTTTVTLGWFDNDWKAIDWQFQAGPNPEEATFPEADAALSKTAMSGYYSFFVN